VCAAVTFKVGPSKTYIWSELLGGFWPFANTLSLVLSGAEALNKLYADQIRAFAPQD
jgi:hypothetical protein